MAPSSKLSRPTSNDCRTSPRWRTRFGTAAEAFLVNNAGTGDLGPAAKVSIRKLKRVVRLNAAAATD